VARIKLEVFDLDRFLDLDAGAYGDDRTERSELVAIAQNRAQQRTGTPFGNDATILIGDTPNDVAAALTAGVRVIGRATGKTSTAELQDAGATWTATQALDVQVLIEAVTRT